MLTKHLYMEYGMPSGPVELSLGLDMTARKCSTDIFGMGLRICLLYSLRYLVISSGSGSGWLHTGSHVRFKEKAMAAESATLVPSCEMRCDSTLLSLGRVCLALLRKLDFFFCGLIRGLLRKIVEICSLTLGKSLLPRGVDMSWL